MHRQGQTTHRHSFLHAATNSRCCLTRLAFLALSLFFKLSKKEACAKGNTRQAQTVAVNDVPWCQGRNSFASLPTAGHAWCHAAGAYICDFSARLSLAVVKEDLHVPQLCSFDAACGEPKPELMLNRPNTLLAGLVGNMARWWQQRGCV